MTRLITIEIPDELDDLCSSELLDRASEFAGSLIEEALDGLASERTIERLSEEADQRACVREDGEACRVLREVSAAEAHAGPYARFNDNPHLLVDVPDGGYTISARTRENELITFAFQPYMTGGPPRCVDVQHQSAQLRTTNGMDENHGEDLPLQSVIVMGPGTTWMRSKPEDRVTLVTVLMPKKTKGAK
jgi:hypothetical protein